MSDSQIVEYEQGIRATDSKSEFGNEKNDSLGFRKFLAKNCITKLILPLYIPDLLMHGRFWLSSVGTMYYFGIVYKEL